jgi:arginine-tRNA-protein transferase
MDGSPEEFLLFLHTSSVKTEEISFRLGGRLVAAVVVDVEPLAMSAVYSYYDPELSSRSLGTFAVLFLIEECRRRGLPYLYLGYYVRDCGRMSYKARFRPSEIRDASGRWVRGERDASASCR